MPNIHQIHDTIQKCKCKYISIEKQNRSRRKILFSGAGLLLKLLQLSLFGEQVVHQLGGADDNADDHENHQHADAHIAQAINKAHEIEIKVHFGTSLCLAEHAQDDAAGDDGSDLT